MKYDFDELQVLLVQELLDHYRGQGNSAEFIEWAVNEDLQKIASRLVQELRQETYEENDNVSNHN